MFLNSSGACKVCVEDFSVSAFVLQRSYGFTPEDVGILVIALGLAVIFVQAVRPPAPGQPTTFAWSRRTFGPLASEAARCLTERCADVGLVVGRG